MISFILGLKDKHFNLRGKICVTGCELATALGRGTSEINNLTLLLR